MDIKLLGIEFEFGKGITLTDLFQDIASKNGAPVVLLKFGRFMYAKDMGKYYAGLLITTKDQKKYLEFTHDPINSKLETKDVTEGAQLADFNFFLISKATGRGVYQHYHNSCSINVFGIICKKHYEDLKKRKIATAIGGLQNPTARQEKLVRDSFAGTLTWNMLVRPEAFKALLESLKSIKSLTISITTLAYKGTIFGPISKHAKRMSQSFKFPANAQSGALVTDITDIVAIPELESARITGTDANGLDQNIKLENNPDSFGIFDYDRVAELMNLSPADFSNSPFMKELIKVIEDKKQIFG